MNPWWILLIGTGIVVGGIAVLRLPAILALLAGAMIVAAITPTESVYQYGLHTKMAPAAARKLADEPTGQRIAEGFGATATVVGIMIAMAAVVGKGLLDSGAAEKIVDSGRRLLGYARAPLVFLISAATVGALALADTAFYLLFPLTKAMRLRTGKNYTLYVLAVVAGSVMSQSLVPPAPGPALMVGEFHLHIATMIVAGMILTAITSLSGLACAYWLNGRWDIPVRPGAGESKAELEAAVKIPAQKQPPLWMALAPILLPVILIGVQAVVEMRHWNGWPTGVRILNSIGEKNVALALAAAVSLLMVRYTRSKGATRIAAVEGLASAGVMVLTICAGGAFGKALQHTDIAEVIKHSMPAESKLLLIPLAFLVASAIRTAQGSATVATITATGIVSPLVVGGELGFHPVYLALAIGCGSKPIHWMNDAGFWIITKMSGFTEMETLKTSSVMVAIMSLVGLGVTLLGAWLMPMAHAGF